MLVRLTDSDKLLLDLYYFDVRTNRLLFGVPTVPLHQPDIYVNGGLLNRVYFTLVKQLCFEANFVFSPRTHKCRVGAGGQLHAVTRIIICDIFFQISVGSKIDILEGYTYNLAI